jgi:hypothetical protein
MAFLDRVRVVLADDNREIISVVRSTLGERVHIIAAVDDGKQAVLAVLELNPRPAHHGSCNAFYGRPAGRNSASEG